MPTKKGRRHDEILDMVLNEVVALFLLLDERVFVCPGAGKFLAVILLFGD